MYHPDGDDIGSLYMDNGYMYFSIKPEEENVGKTVNLNFKINEGNTATIDKIIITGNTNVAKSKVLDMVNLKSGELFSRSKVTQSQKNIAESGLFKSDGVGINLVPHEDLSRVDVEFIVVEL
jgi:outer membrane protein insertion porin family